MTTAMGSPVTFTQSIGGFCMYELTGRYRGVFIELITQPASRAEDVYADMGRVVKGMKGQKATLDRVDLGEGGWAFGSGVDESGRGRGERAPVPGEHGLYGVRDHRGPEGRHGPGARAGDPLSRWGTTITWPASVAYSWLSLFYVLVIFGPPRGQLGLARQPG